MGNEKRLVSAAAGQVGQARAIGVDGKQWMQHIEAKTVAAQIVAGLDGLADVLIKGSRGTGVGVKKIVHIRRVLGGNVVHL